MNRYDFSSNKKVAVPERVKNQLVFREKGELLKLKLLERAEKHGNSSFIKSIINIINECENGRMSAVNIPFDSIGNLTLEKSIRAYLRKLGAAVTDDDDDEVYDEEAEDDGD